MKGLLFGNWFSKASTPQRQIQAPRAGKEIKPINPDRRLIETRTVTTMMDDVDEAECHPIQSIRDVSLKLGSRQLNLPVGKVISSSGQSSAK